MGSFPALNVPWSYDANVRLKAQVVKFKAWQLPFQIPLLMHLSHDFLLLSKDLGVGKDSVPLNKIFNVTVVSLKITMTEIIMLSVEDLQTTWQ